MGRGQIVLHRIEAVCWAGGAGLLAVCLFAGVRVQGARRQAAAIPATPSHGIIASTKVPVQAGPQVVGRVEIPDIGLVTPLLAGDDSMSLSAGAGHIPGTAFPGGLGTVGIAGHRDTHFRQLRRAAVGMDVRLIDRSGTYHYRITSSEIVAPEQVSVLDIQATPGLVLITCYPFSYIGKAPKRFVVHAELLSVTPDVSSS